MDELSLAGFYTVNRIYCEEHWVNVFVYIVIWNLLPRSGRPLVKESKSRKSPSTVSVREPTQLDSLSRITACNTTYARIVLIGAGMTSLHLFRFTLDIHTAHLPDHSC
jgi:hypothetical protein